MMTDTERQLQARLVPTLDQLTPGPPPLAAIIRDGRRARVRRRISLTIGLAVAAGLVIAAPLTLPSLLSHIGGVPPLTTNYRVTVKPPGPRSTHGLVASGTVNGVPWSVRALRATGGGGHYLFTGAGLSTYVSRGSGTLPDRYAHGDPVDEFLGSFTGPAVLVQAVRADVTLVQVAFTNGEVLRLRPIAALGARFPSFVAFAMPDYRYVARIEAFSKRGEIGYTVPWSGHTWFDTARWLEPWQPALPQPQTAVIGSGTTLGHSWQQLAAVGPWGWCGQGDVDGRGGGGGCIAALPPLPRGRYFQIAGFAGGSIIRYSRMIWSAEVPDSVAAVEITTQSGQHTWIRPHRLGGRSFVSFTSAIDLQRGPASLAGTWWAVYDRHHHLLASGSADQS